MRDSVALFGRWVLMSTLFTGATSVGCATAPPKAKDCPALTTCGACTSNLACGWCGDACVAVSGEGARESAPATCSDSWAWRVDMCPGADVSGSEAAPAPESTP